MLPGRWQSHTVQLGGAAPSSRVIRRVLLGLVILAGAARNPIGAQIGELQSVWVSPALPTAQDQIVLHATTICSNPFSGPPSISGQTITLLATELYPPCPPPGPPYDVSFALGTLAPGSYTVEVIVNGPTPAGTVVYSTGFQVAAPGTTADLLGQRFRVRLARDTGCRTCPPSSIQESAVRLSDNSAYFWFFESGNVEVTVKVLDGRPINDHFWVFIASMSDQDFAVTVSDLHNPPICQDLAGRIPASLSGGPPACSTQSYFSPRGTNQNFIDLGSFADPASP